MKKIPALFDSDSSAKKRAKSPMPKRLNSPRNALSENTSNIKVFARFRPLNKMEENNPTQDFCIFPDIHTVLLQQDVVHTFDRVFPPTSNQLSVYDSVGRDAIQDVLNGYNSTIFAYGQTGSGKTYTMFGELRDSIGKGIIPRSIQEIFTYINQSDPECEFVLTCSMLEIYKETLFDLLSMQRPDLKIKESATKGIYVEGLTQISLQSQDELLRIVELGEQTRKVAATRINQYSSRSHTIFMLEIKQKLSNETEKKGKLNLVDLAGSEKVGKTGAQGEILEEAKKINLSLSCLGNVIHALTTNNDHIPYRNSKLTRILQESLGGNYKTSLIVTCSSHASSMDETISTLKFASRAKSIKNHYKMNIKMSSEMMQQMIKDLKMQLQLAHQELEQLKRKSILDIPNENNLIKQYDSQINQEKANKSKHPSMSLMTDKSCLQIDLSFFSSKKASQPENIIDQKENEVNYLKQIDDLRISLGQSKIECQRKQVKITQLNSKIECLEKIIHKLQKGENNVKTEQNQILIDEIISLNDQLNILNIDIDDCQNNQFRDKMDQINFEYTRKLEQIICGEITQSKLTKIISKSQTIEQVMQKLSLQNLFNTIHRSITTNLINLKLPQDFFKKISEIIEESLKHPLIEQGVMDYITHYESIKPNKSEELKIEALKLDKQRYSLERQNLVEHVEKLKEKNEQLIQQLKRQNLINQQKLSQFQLMETKYHQPTTPLMVIDNQRPVSQHSDRSLCKPNTARKPSTFFRYEELL
ncbi:unnamed protein product [Paramecium sonneborni]|uniref:Kinesin-like protein n=1 Tax=Paramecium sonneborni TaxID=65129 RepID=A0A8S1MHP1_9CILI|nr:unnamed protein product [Paramecium sonneborni]